MDQLKQLGELHEQKVLSDEEFEREKAKLLGQ
jgi:Short C-terminal domain